MKIQKIWAYLCVFISLWIGGYQIAFSGDKTAGEVDSSAEHKKPDVHNEQDHAPSLNFVFINQTKLDESKSTFVFDTFRRLTFSTWRDRLLEWRRLNPDSKITFWADGKMTGEKIFQKSKAFLEEKGIDLRDLWEIPIIRAHPHILDSSKHIGLRSDLSRAIVLDWKVRNGAEYAFYADTDIVPMHVHITDNIRAFGFGLGDRSLPSSYGMTNKQFENSVLMLMPSGKRRHWYYIIEVGIEYAERDVNKAREMAFGIKDLFDDQNHPEMQGIWGYAFGEDPSKSQAIFNLYHLLVMSIACKIEKKTHRKIITGNPLLERVFVSEEKLPTILAEKDPR